MKSYTHIIFASGGNDSIALTQHAYEIGLRDVAVAYSNTGWAMDTWAERMGRFKAWVESLGFDYFEVGSEGMENLVDRKKGWPANKPKFCTFELKIEPAKLWMDTIDPERSAICMVGVRREESPARREWPEHQDDSENHGFRDLWAPLVRHLEPERNALIERAGWEVLPHRSKECFPCVNSNREDFRMLALHPDRIELIEAREKAMGPKKLMFRPKRFAGATGIREVVRWGLSNHGKFIPESGGCDSGFCET